MMNPLSVESYLEKILAPISPSKVVTVPLLEAVGMVAAEDMAAKLSVPPFTNSAMDGFAFNSADLSAELPFTLQVVGEVAAGSGEALRCEAGQAIRIMTGAPLPAGANTVVPVELTDQEPGPADLPQAVQVRESVKPGANVRQAGENVQPGDIVVKRGDVLSPAALSALASVGFGQVPVYSRPRVAVISTGDELVPAGVEPGAGQIPDSNSVLLSSLLSQQGYEVQVTPIASDSPEQLLAALQDLANEVDLIISTGGVSAGVYDVVKAATSQLGVDFTKVAMQPGKPQGFGMVNAAGKQIPFVALPGNPVSVFVSFHLFVTPVLATLQGRSGDALTWLEAKQISARIVHEVKSPKGRRQFFPVRFLRDEDGLCCERTHALGSGSHLVATLAQAQGLAIIPAETLQLPADTELPVIDLRLPWF
ncbi:hypothetical protein BK816_06935 [Boudabousia tangfeifanii]|uniref:Molybdopterin molybdenumtransferase n=1 Tax=Boudabousia tangfeifanii TaxID=1912795 RepID=A0A1D9ML71_9ACTO|nr:gephyrin-like molybdotransferase Glp [Boudabousia tangfeifanii]AOZ73054.1 hypothetical protein BK816_06935 [Boudabousia tangfeifanii]